MNKSLKINIPEGYKIDEEKSTFAEIVFKPIDSLETWEDCVKLLKNKDKAFYYITNNSDIENIKMPTLTSENYNLLPSKEIAEKFLILQKLYTCRQAYIGDWKPNWSDKSTPKMCIVNEQGHIESQSRFGSPRIFSFPDITMSNKFLKNFKKDLEFIKEFL